MVLFQLHKRSPPAAAVAGQLVVGYLRIAVQQRMYRTAKAAGTFAVNNAELVDSLVDTGFNIIGYKRSQVLRTESVQIECTVDRQFCRFTAAHTIDFFKIDLLLYDFSVHNHFVDMGSIFEWIAVKQHQIGIHSSLQGTDPLIDA